MTKQQNKITIHRQVTDLDNGLQNVEFSITGGTKEEIELFLEELTEKAKEMGVKFEIHTGRVN